MTWRNRFRPSRKPVIKFDKDRLARILVQHSQMKIDANIRARRVAELAEAMPGHAYHSSEAE